MADIADFPRGGANVLTPLEARKIKRDAEKDILFSESSIDTPAKRKKTITRKKTEKKGDKDVTTSVNKYVDRFSYKYLAPGLLILGYIKEIKKDELVVGLPNGLIGFVEISEVNSYLLAFHQSEVDDDDDVEEIAVMQEIFQVGKLVPVKVIELFPNSYGYKKIKLTVLPSNINKDIKYKNIKENMLFWGSVTSIEDHGYLISFKSKEQSKQDQITGFLSKKDAKDKLLVGSLNWFTVTSTKNQILQLSTKQDALQKVIDNSLNIKFNCLLPGHLVNIEVSKTSDNMLFGKICKTFDCVVESSHTPSNINLEKTKNIPGRIIHVNSTTKQVGVSLLPSIIELSENVIDKKFEIGQFIDECIVKECDPQKGLILALSDQHTGTVHISKISDEVLEKIPKKFKVGSKHRCRVVGYSGMDNTYILTLKQSDFDVEYLLYDNIKPGTVVKGEILTFENFGVLLKITKHIKGFCPMQHLSDIIITDPKRLAKKFVPGKKMQCRVLSVDPAKKSLKLTHKTTLLESKHQIVNDFDKIQLRQPAHGFVTKICANGIVVSFYNNIKGWLPKKNMKDAEKTIEQTFSVNQVILVTVASVQKGEKKVILSTKQLNTDTESKEDDAYKAGETLKAVKVKDFDRNVINVKLPNDSYAILPIQHMSDFITLNKCWEVAAQNLPESFKLKNVIYKGVTKKSEKPVVSLKEVLTSYCTEIKNFDDIQPNKILAGVITSIMPYGLFVEFAPNVVGLCPTNFVADSPIDDISKQFKVGQSVVAKVNDPMDTEKQRFTVTLKPAVLLKHAHHEINQKFCTTSLLLLYLQQREHLFKIAKRLEDSTISTFPALIGQVITVKVNSSKGDVWEVEYEKDGNIFNGLMSEKLTENLKEGMTVRCYVINVDIGKKIFHGIAGKDVIENVLEEDEKEIKENENICACVAYINNDVCVVTLPGHHHKIAYMSPRKHLNHIVIRQKLMVGQELYVQFVGSYKKNFLVKRSDETLSVGSLINGFVKGIKACQLNIDIPFSRIHGRVHITQASDDIVDGESPLACYKVKQPIAAKVIAIRDMKTHSYLPISHPHGKSYLELSVKPSVLQTENVEEVGRFAAKTFKDFKIGEKVNCYTTSTSSQCLYAAINSTAKAKLPFLHLSTDLREMKRLVENVMIGFPFETTIVHKEHETLILSRIGPPSELIKKGAIVVGRIIKKTNKPGLLIQLPGMRAGLAHITELSDTYEENMLANYKEDLFVRCFIVDASQKKIDLSLRESRLENNGKTSEGEDRLINGYDDIKEGDILRGFVKSCSKVGVFVSLTPNIDARVQIKNLSQFFVKEFESHFPVGRLVKGKVLKIDPVTNHIDLSLRGKDVGSDDLFPPPESRKRKLSINDDEDDGASPIKKLPNENEILSSEVVDDDVVVIDNDKNKTDANENEISLEVTQETPDSNTTGVLKLSKKFDWSGEVETEEKKNDMSSEDSDEDDDVTQESTKKTKRQKRAAKKAEEDSLRKAEMALLDTERGAETSEDFERIVLGSPNSSIVWIQYMAFHLHSSEVAKARTVAKRALKTISFREEQEKFNVWVALLNLEASYGGKAELQTTFKEALKVNEPKKVYFVMVDIYSKDTKYAEEANSLYQEMLRRFKSSKRVWTSYAYYLMSNGERDTARNLLPRSLKSLPERKYMDTMVKFGILEYKFGEAQRGATVFETVIKHHPRRTDIWSIYIDMTIKQGEWEQVRNIFERVITLSLSPKKMKFFYKRYINFEEQYGTPNTLKIVQNKAMEYAESRFSDI